MTVRAAVLQCTGHPLELRDDLTAIGPRPGRSRDQDQGDGDLPLGSVGDLDALVSRRIGFEELGDATRALGSGDVVRQVF